MSRHLENSEPRLDRRAFHKLTSSALGGMLAGAVVGCAKEPAKGGNGAKGKAGDKDNHDHEHEHDEFGDHDHDDEMVSLLLEEPHVCRGLNACKIKGKGGENECAGRGTCASAATHACATHNECKGQGGCGAKPGENACKGKGGCGVPMKGKMWEKARANFEAAMTKAGKNFGEAPEASAE